MAIVLGAVVVATMFPSRDDEQALLAQYQAEDAAAA